MWALNWSCIMIFLFIYVVTGRFDFKLESIQDFILFAILITLNNIMFLIERKDK